MNNFTFFFLVFVTIFIHFGIFNFFFSCDAEVVVLLLFAMEKCFLQNQPYKIHGITSSDIFLFAPLKH